MIVDLRIPIAEAASKIIGNQRRACDQLAGTMRFMAVDVRRAGEQIVQGQAESNRCQAARTVAIDGQQNLQSMHELRDVLQQPGALPQ